MKLIIKNKLSQNEINGLPYLLNTHPPLLVSSSIISPSGYLKYFVNRTLYFLSVNKKNKLLILKQEGIQGIALLRFKEWDSSFFRTPIGCIEYILVNEKLSGIEVNKIEKRLLKSCIELGKKLGLKIIYLSIEPENYSLTDALSCAGFNFICAEMVRAIRREDLPNLCAEKKIKGKLELRRYKVEDYSQIMNIAEIISKEVKSKYSLTSYLIQQQRNKYYLESIKNCCLGLNADEIFVAVKNKAVVGFICYRYDKIFEKSLGKKMCFLVMIGISQLERRKSIGTYLVDWAHKQVLKSSGVLLGRTYLHNLGMIRFVLKRGMGDSSGFAYTFCKRL
jgi:hypothetical protein